MFFLRHLASSVIFSPTAFLRPPPLTSYGLATDAQRTDTDLRRKTAPHTHRQNTDGNRTSSFGMTAQARTINPRNHATFIHPQPPPRTPQPLCGSAFDLGDIPAQSPPRTSRTTSSSTVSSRPTLTTGILNSPKRQTASAHPSPPTRCINAAYRSSYRYWDSVSFRSCCLSARHSKTE